MWRLAGLLLTQKNLQCTDPWQSFQSLNILAWSEKQPLCRSFQASLGSTFRSHLFHSPSLEETEGLLLKGHYKIGVQLPTTHSQLSSLVEWLCLVAQVTGLTSGANSAGLGRAGGCEQGTRNPGLFVYVVFLGCLSSSPSVPASEAFMLWAIVTAFSLTHTTDPSLFLLKATNKNMRKTVKIELKV